MAMLNEWTAKETICEIGRRLYAKGFAAANDGNITARVGENRLVCTPTGVSKGYMKPEDLCIIDLDGNQLAGTKRRSSEVLLHLTIYKARPDINGVLHCHPPHATAFAIAHEPIPKCVLPEVEVFLGEVPIARYETPGGQPFADTVLPYVKDANTVLLANHGTVAYHTDLMTAYFNTEIIDAYCRMLLLARQLGPINYLGEQKSRELLDLKKRFGLTDPRTEMENCDLCGNSMFREGYDDFVPKSRAFVPPDSGNSCTGLSRPGNRSANGSASTPAAAPSSNQQGSPDLEALVQAITNQVMTALGQRR